MYGCIVAVSTTTGARQMADFEEKRGVRNVTRPGSKHNHNADEASPIQRVVRGRAQSGELL